LKEVLIIRSASFQQLDKNLPAIMAKFPETRLSILTHEHGVKIAQKYADIDEVFSYNFRSGFSYFKWISSLREKKFDAVVMPVTNVTGSGFVNVFLFSLRIQCRQRWICNLVSDFTEVKKRDILFKATGSALFKLLSLLFTAGLSILTVAMLPILFYRISKK